MSKYKTLVLYYHRVEQLENDYNLLSVSPIKFRQQMLCLKKKYLISRFEEEWSELDHNSVVVTFDDGYLDNFTYALPILEELEIPATIFISTGTLQTGTKMWWDELEDILLCGENFPDCFQLKDEIFGCLWKTNTKELRINCYQALHYMIKNLITPKKREDWFEQLRKWRNPYVNGGRSMLLSVECQKLAESKYISLGAHTVSHPSLASLEAEEQEYEIRQSILELEALCEKKISLFSYPFGCWQKDFNEMTIGICKSLGIKKAASTIPGLWKKGMDNYRIPRNVVRDWNVGEFSSYIDTLWRE